MESTPKLSTPEEELAYLREQVTRKEAELAQGRDSGQAGTLERTQIISETIHAHDAAPAEMLAREYRINEATKSTETDAILADLNLGGGEQPINGLQATM